MRNGTLLGSRREEGASGVVSCHLDSGARGYYEIRFPLHAPASAAYGSFVRSSLSFFSFVRTLLRDKPIVEVLCRSDHRDTPPLSHAWLALVDRQTFLAYSPLF